LGLSLQSLRTFVPFACLQQHCVCSHGPVCGNSIAIVILRDENICVGIEMLH
jgi:hypothetical protein